MICKICCSGTSSSWEVEVTGVILPYLTFFSNGFLNNVLLDFFSFFHKQEKSWNGIFISWKSINKMNGTSSIFWSWFPRSFLSNGSCVTAFIHASLSCLHLMGPGKACKWNDGLYSRQSLFFLQLPSALRLCSAQVSFFHLLIS